jgi:hypothetical protein
MGSGKGAVDYWVATVKPGTILFEISSVPEEVARAASICRDVIQFGSNACKPKFPKQILAPRVLVPRIRPRWYFLYFVLFGLNITNECNKNINCRNKSYLFR